MHVFRWILASGNVWYLSSKQVHYPEYVHAYLCWFGSYCFTQDSARLPERRRKKERKKKTKTNNLRGRRFRFTTLDTSVSRAKGILKLRKFAGSFLDGWNFDERRDSEDLQRLLESRHLDLRRRISDLATLMDSSEALTPNKKAGIVNSR